MEEYITVSAKNLDDAITEALVQLGVTSDRLDYIVVEKGSAGFLGIGMKQAVIKARRKVEEKPVEEIVKEEPVKEVKKEKAPAKPAREWKEKKKKPERKAEKPVKEEPVKPVKEEKAKVAEEPVKEAEVPEKKEPELVKVEQQTIETCEKFIYDVLNAMDMTDVKVTSTIDEEGALSIDMEGSNMGILIGNLVSYVLTNVSTAMYAEMDYVRCGIGIATIIALIAANYVYFNKRKALFHN